MIRSRRDEGKPWAELVMDSSKVDINGNSLVVGDDRKRETALGERTKNFTTQARLESL
ncbi:hypothetical protein P7K49_035458, partial [Saguinus oedipus]